LYRETILVRVRIQGAQQSWPARARRVQRFSRRDQSARLTHPDGWSPASGQHTGATYWWYWILS